MSFVSRYLDPALVERLNKLQLSARRVVEGSISGQHRSRLKGASIEFRQHRFYSPGDEPRRLDWRVLARTDRPYIKEYDEETNLRALLMLDVSGSMKYGQKYGSKLEYAGRLVASLSYLMLAQSESVGLALCAEKLNNFLAPAAGSRQLSRVIDILERVTPLGATNWPASLNQAADRLDRRSLVIVVSDLLVPTSQLREGLARLRHDRHETILLRVVDPDELEFPFRNWTHFRGLEAERSQLLEPAMVRKSYLDAFERHRQELDASCASLGVESHFMITRIPMIDALTEFLQRRWASHG